jgi:hypothetical protein
MWDCGLRIWERRKAQGDSRFRISKLGTRPKGESPRDKSAITGPYAPLNLGRRPSRKRRYSEDQFAQLQAEHQFGDTEY